MQAPTDSTTYDLVVQAARTPMLGVSPCTRTPHNPRCCIEALPASDWCSGCRVLWAIYHKPQQS